ISSPALRKSTLEGADVLRSGLAEIGIQTGGFGHIVPWVLGSSERALFAARELAERGYEVAPMRPPTVPDGTARIRLAVTAAHTRSDVLSLVHAINDV